MNYWIEKLKNTGSYKEAVSVARDQMKIMSEDIDSYINKRTEIILVISRAFLWATALILLFTISSEEERWIKTTIICLIALKIVIRVILFDGIMMGYKIMFNYYKKYWKALLTIK